MVSLLRKRRSTKLLPSQDDSTLRHSLSLPDLTTPLLNPESWEELPSFAFNPISGQTHTTPVSRGRKASLLGSPGGAGGTPQFHRPFTPWQLVAKPEAPTDFGPGYGGSAVKAGDGSPTARRGATVLSASQLSGGGSEDNVDFRVSRARWGRDIGGGRTSSMSGDGWKRKRGKGKVTRRLNVVVVGPKGVGKTR